MDRYEFDSALRMRLGLDYEAWQFELLQMKAETEDTWRPKHTRRSMEIVYADWIG